MKRIGIFIFLFILFLNPTLAKADIIIPTETSVFFSLNGKPYNKPVNFEVVCFGYQSFPGSPDFGKTPANYTPEKVYSFSASCPSYRCKINEGYYLNYRHIDYCDLNGKTAGQTFQIAKFGDSPIQSCDNNFDNRKCTLKFEIPTSQIKPVVIQQNFLEQIILFFQNLFRKN